MWCQKPTFMNQGCSGKAPKMPEDDRPIDRLGKTSLARAATDEGIISPSATKNYVGKLGIHSDFNPENPYEPQADTPQPIASKRQLTTKLSETSQRNSIASSQRQKSSNGQHAYRHSLLGDKSLTAQMHNISSSGDDEAPSRELKPGSISKLAGEKLGTFSGVFVPTTLNVLSVLMFLRFGFILGQSGVVGMMGMLLVAYVINLITTLSVSAIATNGTVRGGGAYYLISRSLGPEFGGSIGIVFYLGSVFNTGMNAVGLVECLKANFGERTGNWANWLPEGSWFEFAWASFILFICTCICLAGSGIFARCSTALLVILLAATFSIPFSALVLAPSNNRGFGIDYTGLSVKTFLGNLLPQFTKGADGSQLSGKENFQDLFGILFPATGGIFAGASMSGDLKYPSKAIPKGTLSGLALTFFSYTVVILAMAATITRESFYDNVNVIQDTSVSEVLILLGEFATAFFSSLMGVIGSAKLLQALARDHLLPGFSIFAQGTKGSDEPTNAVIVTYIVAQLTMLADINSIASFVTMAYLMTFLVTNLACFLLTISSAPNFRPSFHYFNWWTAGFGALICGISMFFVDNLYAAGCVSILIIIFLIIHYTTPPKSWGDVSQSLIYHQVRKYLLRLKQEHVKFWRPQILLFVNDPRRQYELIQFCNSLKKGALFILGHVIVSDDFAHAVPEARRQQTAWTKFIEVSKVKAFVNVAISPTVEWGTRNIVLSAGLGGMRPNIVVMGAYNLDEYWASRPLIDLSGAKPSAQVPPHALRQIAPQNAVQREQRELRDGQVQGILPTDSCKTEEAVGIKSYVTVLEDLLIGLRINVAIAKGFRNLEVPNPGTENKKKYIDLWPIQMSAEIATESGEEKRNVLTTNFDTYTLILQLGCILNTVSTWKKAYTLRVAVFVEYESDVEEERGRVKTLLDNLRIPAKVLVFWLASGELKTYRMIVNGDQGENDQETEKLVEEVLRNEEWWDDIQKQRGRGRTSTSEELAGIQARPNLNSALPSSSFQSGQSELHNRKFRSLTKMMRKSRKHRSSSALRGLRVRFGMQTHKLNDDLLHRHAASASESSDSYDSYSGSSDDGSSGRASAASENDIDDFVEETDERVLKLQTTSGIRRHSLGDSLRGISITKRTTSPNHSIHLLKTPSRQTENNNASKGKSSQQTTKIPESAPNQTSRPPLLRQPTAAKFTSHPVPKTQVASNDGPGPSIMFTDSVSPKPKLSPPGHRRYSVRNNTSSTSPFSGYAAGATGYPFPQNMPLSFNDLPCRAQHMILNELMRQHSHDTAVLLTTLPSPLEGTCHNEEDCVRYLSDLEVFCQELPPVLLVHSNSMTVTMNL